MTYHYDAQEIMPLWLLIHEMRAYIDVNYVQCKRDSEKVDQ